MKALTIELETGKEQSFQSLGWKTLAPGNHRSQFFAIASNGKPVVVSLTAAKASWYLPGHPSYFRGEPFPEAVCIGISPCRLLPPPCYQSRIDFKRQSPCHATFEPWKAVYLQTHNENLILSRQDAKPLRARLKAWRTAIRTEYKRRTIGCRNDLKRLETTSLEKLGFGSEAQRQQQIVEVQEQLNFLESKERVENFPCKGWLGLTLADVMQNVAGLRDAWLADIWAKVEGRDLRKMMRERLLFRLWLEEHTGTPSTVFHQQTREHRRELSPPDFGSKLDQHPQFLEACAAVCYLAKFASNLNDTVFLSGCEIREELTVAELDEVARLKQVTTRNTRDQNIAFTPSPNYRQLFWHENGQQYEAKLTNKQASAISALHQADGFVLARDEWQQEIYGDSPPSDFRPDKLFAYRDGLMVWKRFIRVERERYRLVFDQR